MSIEHLFFELLQVAIGNRQALSTNPSAQGWNELFALSKKQALTAVAFAGVTRLNTTSDFGSSLDIPEMVYLNWLGLSAKIQQRNRELNAACASLCKDLAHEGLFACILKGQSNLANYPEAIRDCRTPGDIDVWCGLMDPEGIDIAVADLDGKGAHYEKYVGERGVIEWVLADWRLKGNKMPEVQYHHIDWKYKGIECEVHFKPSWMNNPLYNARLQKWCKENEQWQALSFSPTLTSSAQRLRGEEAFNVPTIEFNAVYQLVHVYRHLFNEGIGLRQLLDYYYVLQALEPSLKKNCLGTLKRFGMKPFASAVMYVLQEVFAMPEEYMICEPNAKRGRFLLSEIMLAGNFGKFDARNVIAANEGSLGRFVRRQKRFVRFLWLYPSEVIWGPYFSVKQRLWRMWHGWR